VSGWWHWIVFDLPATRPSWRKALDHLNVAPTSTAANIDYEISQKTLAKASITRLYQRPAQ
jgi:phosphatidylethanolamine-binding protein (PEBP) family uncharacterized protein